MLALARLLAARLERLSADSRWAHKASGLRGTLLRCIEQSEQGQPQPIRMADLITQGFEIVENAAKEIGERE